MFVVLSPAGNLLHHYSQVYNGSGALLPLPMCPRYIWVKPKPLNESEPRCVALCNCMNVSLSRVCGVVCVWCGVCVCVCVVWCVWCVCVCVCVCVCAVVCVVWCVCVVFVCVCAVVCVCVCAVVCVCVCMLLSHLLLLKQARHHSAHLRTCSILTAFSSSNLTFCQRTNQ